MDLKSGYRSFDQYRAGALFYGYGNPDRAFVRRHDRLIPGWKSAPLEAEPEKERPLTFP